MDPEILRVCYFEKKKELVADEELSSRLQLSSMPAGTGVGTVRAGHVLKVQLVSPYRLIYKDNKTLSAFDFIDYLTVIIYDFYPSGRVCRYYSLSDKLLWFRVNSFSRMKEDTSG